MRKMAYDGRMATKKAATSKAEPDKAETIRASFYISAVTHRDIAVEAAVRGVSLAACAGSILEEYFKKPRRAR